MKQAVLTSVICIALLAPAVLCVATDQYPETVAKVNGNPISSATLERKVKEAFSTLEARGQTAEEESLKKNVLESLINNELLYQESVKAGYRANEVKIEMQYATIKGQFDTEKQFLNTLGVRGYTEESLREELGRVIAIDDYIGGVVAKRVTVPEEDMLQYYEENTHVFWEPESIRASHILAKVDDPSDERQKKDALGRIKAVKKKLDKGDSFETLAKEHSDCPSSSQGGDLGYFVRGQMVKPFDDAAFAMDVGEISDVVETRFGYHLIKLVDKKPEHTVPFEEVRGDIEQWLGEQMIFEELKMLIEGLKKEATIERYL
jgi:peptidyl-prolyl cis-trans isomerase C